MHFTITVNINTFYFLITLQWDCVHLAVSCLLAQDQATGLVKAEGAWMDGTISSESFQLVLAESTKS